MKRKTTTKAAEPEEISEDVEEDETLTFQVDAVSAAGSLLYRGNDGLAWLQLVPAYE